MPTVTTPRTTWTPERILASLAKDANVEKALLRLYREQTTLEQAAGTTREDNARGFNAPDSSILSYRARWLLSGRHLSGKHLEDSRTRLRKYATQLATYATQSALSQERAELAAWLRS